MRREKTQSGERKREETFFHKHFFSCCVLQLDPGSSIAHRVEKRLQKAQKEV